jgi:aldose 1-epimerase
MTRSVLFILCILFSVSCGKAKEGAEVNHLEEQAKAKRGFKKESFGTLQDGKEVFLYTLTNAKGMSASVMNYGGIIVSLTAPDKNGSFEDVVLGYDNLTSYVRNNPYFGALIGRFGNRIAKGKFTLDGQVYTLPANNGPNHLHGGRGFDKVFWDIAPTADSTGLILTYTSADGEQGYPGTLTTKVVYTLTDNNEFKIDYEATTDKKTIVNLTQHTYFNLSGDKHAPIKDHALQLDAPYFLPVDNTLIPTGELKSVKGTPFDFTASTIIGDKIDADDAQIKAGGGFDHCWVFENAATPSVRKIATLYEKESGRVMEVLTDQPAIQFYSGNFLDGRIKGKKGVAYAHRSGLCLETQHFPDAPNQPAFPSTVLAPGETYKTTTIYKFSAK